jgi:hypothetical protein
VRTPGEPEDVEEQFPGWHAWNVQSVPETRRPASYICNEGSATILRLVPVSCISIPL